MQNTSLSSYLKDATKEELITQEEEIRLAIQIRKGDQASLNKLVKANLRFVISIAKQYQNAGVDLEDLISEGNIGLITAANKFDHTKGYKFISYAVWWIRQSILQSLCENSRTIRIPANIIAENQKIKKANESMKSLEEIPLIDIPTTSSYHNLMGEDGEFIDVIEDLNSPAPDFDMLSKEQLETCLRQCTIILTDREKDIIFKYFGLTGSKWTLEAIAEDLGLTRERVRQIKEKSLKKLRAEYQYCS